MSYFDFLIRFLVVPILILGVIAIIDHRRRKEIPEQLHAVPIWAAIALHMFIALAYTTLWDNYLVATRVWWYDPKLVTGITIGWVPIEEYTFFILQPLLAGVWMLFLLRRLQIPEKQSPLQARERWIPFTALLFIWIISIILMFAGTNKWTYITLELAWALPPIGLQVVFGGDILRRYWKLTVLTILPLTLYLSAMDEIAINSGTWTINPDKSLGILLTGILPIEEFLFFLLTNTLVTFGITLFLAQESWQRFRQIAQWLNSLRSGELKATDK